LFNAIQAKFAQARPQRREDGDKCRPGHAADQNDRGRRGDGERGDETCADLKRCRDDIGADKNQEQVERGLRLVGRRDDVDLCCAHLDI
jgi:hypothetical protein